MSDSLTGLLFTLIVCFLNFHSYGQSSHNLGTLFFKVLVVNFVRCACSLGSEVYARHKLAFPFLFFFLVSFLTNKLVPTYNAGRKKF